MPKLSSPQPWCRAARRSRQWRGQKQQLHSQSIHAKRNHLSSESFEHLRALKCAQGPCMSAAFQTLHDQATQPINSHAPCTPPAVLRGESPKRLAPPRNTKEREHLQSTQTTPGSASAAQRHPRTLTATASCSRVGLFRPAAPFLHSLQRILWPTTDTSYKRDRFHQPPRQPVNNSANRFHPGSTPGPGTHAADCTSRVPLGGSRRGYSRMVTLYSNSRTILPLEPWLQRTLCQKPHRKRLAAHAACCVTCAHAATAAHLRLPR